jgi:DNA modification methylase
MKANMKNSKLRDNETLNQVSNSLGTTAEQHVPGRSAADPRVSEGDGARKIEMVSITSLKPATRNARTHSKNQIGEIARSMERFGVINPIIVDARDRIVAGHGRLEAAKLLGLKSVPTIRIKNLSDTELRAYMLADNRIAESAGWDKQLLAIELSELQITLPEIGLDLSITGFEPDELDRIFGDFTESQNSTEAIPEIAENATARLGDLYHLGKHRLIVGDARDRSVYDRLMGSDIAEMAFLDPPYNVPLQGNAAGHGKIKYREFAQASGELSSPQFVQFLKESLGNCARVVRDGGIFYICMDWRHSPEMLDAGAAVFDELKNVCVWVKPSGGQGSFYRSAHEFVFVFKKGKGAHINTFGLGQNGRTRTNVWNYAGVNSFRAGRMDDLKMHPTVKPVDMIADAMKDCSRRGSIILDSFCGSGSTIMAAEQVGRRAYCIEIDPGYADVAIRRWQRSTKKDAILDESGEAFDELARPHNGQAKTKGRHSQ